MTSLEGYAILKRLTDDVKKALLARVQAGVAGRRFQPLVTINQMAEMCASGKDLPEEESDLSWGECPILTNNKCPIYAIRPFACRSMVSRINCGGTGYADMEPFVLTVNTVFQQVIEHVDLPGYFGNFTDLLLYLSSTGNHRPHEEHPPERQEHRLLPNWPLKVLMIPPGHRNRIQPILKALRHIMT